MCSSRNRSLYALAQALAASRRAPFLQYTLDYNAEATFFGAYAANHAAQVESYWDYLLQWQAPGRAMAQLQAAQLGVSCDADALHYACHLAPWGFQSFDTTYYMHWNGHYSTLAFINNVEYTLNASFARDVALPYVTGHNLWWACALNKTSLPGGSYTYRDTRQDAQHEGQVVPDPQIGLALAARTVQAELLMRALLGAAVAPPPSALLLDIAAHLAPFNTVNWSFSPPPPGNSSNVSYEIYENQRFSGDTGMHTGVATLAECEALCSSLGGEACALFTFCPNTTVPTCDDGESCWQFTVAQLPTLHAGPGFTSGRRTGPPGPPAEQLTVWSAYAGASAGQSDSFAIYPLWPSEALISTGAPLDAATAAIAQASARAYIDWPGGRSVDVFASAVLAGLGFDFAGRAGGSVVSGGGAPAAPAVAFSPAEVLAGFNAQIGGLFGGNLLLRAPGGGVENVGVSRAVAEMLATSVGGAVGGVILVFGFWPADEPATFQTLLVKGGFAVSASYSNTTRRVASPVVVSAQHTWASAASATARLRDPWGAGPSGGVAVSCGGVDTPVAWSGAVMSFDAPLSVDCAVSAPLAAANVV